MASFCQLFDPVIDGLAGLCEHAGAAGRCIMVETILAALLIGGLILAVAVSLLLFMRRKSQTCNLLSARRRFQIRREWLEAKFFTLASDSGSPRGLEWVDVDFDDAVKFARDRKNGNLRALVGVTVRFRAVEGGPLDGNPNADNPRAATAVFYLDGEEWSTKGRTVFNLNPAQAIQHFKQELELVE